jgi:tRNA wybutosine-synthesizing protein 4
MATPTEASQWKEDKKRDNKERRIKEKREKSDNDIQEVTTLSPLSESGLTLPETNSSSILSKRSVERLYLEPGKKEFFKYFVTKDARRSPLINRNYWIRMEAIEQAVLFHLNRRVGERKKVVVNLGCGL